MTSTMLAVSANPGKAVRQRVAERPSTTMHSKPPAAAYAGSMVGIEGSPSTQPLSPKHNQARRVVSFVLAVERGPQQCESCQGEQWIEHRHERDAAEADVPGCDRHQRGGNERGGCADKPRPRKNSDKRRETTRQRRDHPYAFDPNADHLDHQRRQVEQQRRIIDTPWNIDRAKGRVGEDLPCQNAEARFVAPQARRATMRGGRNGHCRDHDDADERREITRFLL